MIWKSPVYRFRIPTEETEDCEELKEILIDVTGSAPPFKVPSENLKSILNDIFSSTELKKIDSVLEFGAAKFKNIPFILEKGKYVCAVEFEELTKNPDAKKNIKKCQKKGGAKFEPVVFPRPFIDKTQEFDLGLMLNVLPVMPVFAERMYALQLMYNKIKEGKYLLWVAQKEGPIYKKIREAGKSVCGDGIWMGSNRYVKTFYRYHNVDEVDEMMALSGFELIKRFPGGDDARLYRKTKYNLFAGLLTPGRIIKEIPNDSTIKNPSSMAPLIVKNSEKTKPVKPNPKPLSVESLYIEKIKSLPRGAEHAEVYHRVVSLAISRIFRGSFRNIDFKFHVDGGIQIIDTLFTNCAEKGFFKRLRDVTACNYPVIEAKNITGDLTNAEVLQLHGELKPERGKFGILVCRDISDEDAVFNRCQAVFPVSYILFLTDKDIFEMLQYSKEGNLDAIDDIMDNKLRKLMFKPK